MLHILGRFMRPALAVLLGLLLASCSRSAAVRPHNQLTIVQTQDFPSLDPVFVSGVGGQELAALLFRYLVKLDADGRLVADAATLVPSVANGGISPDGLRVTYHLRPGLRFSDGTPLTSYDVAETIGHIGFPGSDAPSRNAFDDVEAVSTPDAGTVRVFLRKPYAPIVLYLCGPGNAVPILSARQLAGHAHLRNTDLDTQPVGAGPYRVRRWLRGQRLELETNPYYAGAPPAIRAITIVPVPDSETALEMLRAHEVDAYVNADDSQTTALAAIPGVRAEVAPIDGTGALIFDTARPMLADARVRRAIAESFDSPRIVDRALLGNRAHDPGRGLFEWAYDPAAYAMPRYDPRDAAQLLDAAGWRRGPGGLRQKGGVSLSLELIVRADKPSGVEMATQMLEQMRASGIAITIRRFDVVTLVSPNGPLYGGHYDLALFPFIAGFDPDVYDQFACSRIPPRGFNKPRFCNPALDRLMLDAVRPYDRQGRLPYYRSIERILARELPMLAMYQAESIDAFPAWLHGERSAPNTPFWNVADWR